MISAGSITSNRPEHKMTKAWKIFGAVAVIAVAVIAVALFAIHDHEVRCHGKPLTREEAIERATYKIQRFSVKFDTGNAPPRLVEENYDAEQKTWIFKYHTDACDVYVVADRCEGTEIGGETGCNPR